MSAATRHGRTLRAFSLAEVLIVIGIIAILISLLLPTVSKMRSQARTTQCASNLSQIYKAELAWKAEHSSDRVGFGGDYSAMGWMGTLNQYLASADASSGEMPRVYFCPEDLRPLSSLGVSPTAGNAGSGTGGNNVGTGGAAGGTGGVGTGDSGSTSQILPQNLFIRWYSDSYGTYDMPVAAGPRVHVENVKPGPPASYELWFEQEPASVNEMIDFNDLVLVLKDNQDGTSTITLSPKADGSAHAKGGSALVNKGTNPETIIWDHCYRPGGTQPNAKLTLNASIPSVSGLGTTDPGGTTGGSTGDSTSKTVAHYGLNNAINTVMGHSDKVLGMDYLVDLIDSNVDNWVGPTWVDQSNYTLRFARHGKQGINMLFGDGSVKFTAPVIPNDMHWDPIYPGNWVHWKMHKN
jgi:prepilin-type processing-associated H-X9-DG protein